jgi:glycosyltransferase involved in cell wall biosynthesis
MRRVLMLTNAVAPDQLGGLQRYVRELSAALVRAGAEVAVVTRQIDASDPERELGADGVALLRYPVAPRTDPLYFARYPLAAFGSAWRSARPAAVRGTTVHAHFSLPGLAAALSGRPYVQTFHAPSYKEIRAERQGRYALPAVGLAEAGLRAAERRIVQGAGAIAVLSEFMREEVRALSPRAAERTWLIPGGMDTTWFSPGPGTTHPFAEEGAGPLLFTARRFVPRTGVRELVRALPAVLAAVPGARLAVAGDGALREEVERDVARLGLTEHVRLLGRVSNDELLGWYRRADAFVMPTQELEGFGLSAAEALACGTPVIGTPAGAVPELLAPLDPRLICPGVGERELAGGIVAALGDPELLPAVAARARAHVHPGMSWDAVAARYLELYDAADAAR